MDQFLLNKALYQAFVDCFSGFYTHCSRVVVELTNDTQNPLTVPPVVAESMRPACEPIDVSSQLALRTGLAVSDLGFAGGDLAHTHAVDEYLAVVGGQAHLAAGALRSEAGSGFRRGRSARR